MVIFWKYRTNAKSLQNIQKGTLYLQPTLYSYNVLRVATKDFHPRNKLGQGGFGVVYKGILSDGTTVAVKHLTKSQQGVDDFLNEVIVITGVRHRNLVKLKGCCVHGTQRFLVFEYMENSNLAEALWDQQGQQTLLLDWPKRLNICVGVARGLAYLHEDSHPRIIHRDIKATNILLDKNMNAKIADFGLARLFPDDQSHISTQIAGTIGYLAPEYATLGELTPKADVYSFGILLLEIVSGRKNIDSTLAPNQIYLIKWALFLYESNMLTNLVEETLDIINSENEVQRVINVALLCVQIEPTIRPLMSHVLAMLQDDQNHLPLHENMSINDGNILLMNQVPTTPSPCHQCSQYKQCQCVSFFQSFIRGNTNVETNEMKLDRLALLLFLQQKKKKATIVLLLSFSSSSSFFVALQLSCNGGSLGQLSCFCSLLSPSTTIACWVVFMKLEGSAKFEPVILPTTSMVLRHPLHEQLVQKVQLVKNGFHVCSEKGRLVLVSIDEHILYARVFWYKRRACLGARNLSTGPSLERCSATRAKENPKFPEICQLLVHCKGVLFRHVHTSPLKCTNEHDALGSQKCLEESLKENLRIQVYSLIVLDAFHKQNLDVVEQYIGCADWIKLQLKVGKHIGNGLITRLTLNRHLNCSVVQQNMITQRHCSDLDCVLSLDLVQSKIMRRQSKVIRQPLNWKMLLVHIWGLDAVMLLGTVFLRRIRKQMRCSSLLYPHDGFDRYWFPIQGSNSTFIRSTSPLQSLVASKIVGPNNNLWGNPPETVMDTALTSSGNITITFPDNYSYEYILSFYYAELNSTANASSRNFYLEVVFFCFQMMLVATNGLTSLPILQLAKIFSENETQTLLQPTLYSYNVLRVATKDFHPRNKLGQGGFGVVYKGILSDGTTMAVKHLTKSQQGVDDFLNEVIVITGVRHRNLVKLKGCCVHGTKRFLVFEYMENSNLANVLWDQQGQQTLLLDWPKRLNICVGVARGLAYLHEDSHPRIIHRDIKATNILLDKNMNAKIADFGLARLFLDDQSHISTQIAGTM
ncbi:unnamed protein product [Sphagnum jensenii]|uniref:Protein kinase domain-containing protein n=1 Tax=Sphagnum jensenii TaxID=128206 RepID=A0ABP1AZM5_9BRYO